jgi:hypothetical protein
LAGTDRSSAGPRLLLVAGLALAASHGLGFPEAARAEPTEPGDRLASLVTEAPFIGDTAFRRPRHRGEVSAMLTLIEADFLDTGTTPDNGFAGLEDELAGLIANREERKRALDCLALNIYHESRNEPLSGMSAVAHVVLNRVADPRFPAAVCEVIRQGGERINRCQFSWWCDGLSDRPKNHRKWRAIKAIALDAYWGRSADPTGGALWYHADYVSPYWARIFLKGPTIGRHIFYLDQPLRTQVAILTARANGADRLPDTAD